MDASAGMDPNVPEEALPSDDDIHWAGQQTVEMIRRARDLDSAIELEEMGR